MPALAPVGRRSYLPQIRHPVHERCSAGISRGAFSLWLLASILMTIHAVLLPAVVFIVLGAVQRRAANRAEVRPSPGRSLSKQPPPERRRIK